MKRPNRTLSILSLSALDVLAMSTGVFVLLVVILMPYYRMTFDAGAESAGLRVATEALQAEIDEARRAAAAEAAAASEAEAEADHMLRAAADLRASAASLRDEADAADGRAGADDRLVGQMQATLNRRIIPALDLVFVIDTTASMALVTKELALSMAGLVRILERLVPSLRIGVVAYRDHELGGWVTRDLPLRSTSVALGDILAFTESLEASRIGGRTVTEAVYEGLGTALAMSFRPGAKQTVIVIGDAAAHQLRQAATLAMARGFAGSGPRRSVSTLFVPTRSFRRFGRGDREFFAALANAGRGAFTQNEGELLEGILLSVLEN